MSHVAEARLAEPLGRALADEALGARARVDPGRLDADDAGARSPPRGRDADQRDDLLRREPGHRRALLDRVARDDPHLGAAGALPLGDLRAMCSASSSTSSASPITTSSIASLEQLREARHVDALLRAVQVDGAVDLARR